jgi:hypothetical protein
MAEDQRLIIQKYYPNKVNALGKSDWRDGELVRAGQLNHIEDGLAELSKLDILPQENSERALTSGGAYLAIKNATLSLTTEIETKVPKDLGSLSIVPASAQRAQLFLYVDNNGSPNKMSIADLANLKIRTIDEEILPENLQVGDYIFLKK